jgi:gluconolactonase
MRFPVHLVAATLVVGTVHTQVPAARDFRIIRLDPALDAIVAADARLETLGDRFGLTEGPVWVPDPAGAFLAFSDLTANVIYKRTPDGQLSALAENIVAAADVLTAGQQTRSGRMATIILGANGLTLDRQGRLVVCSPAARVVMRMEKDGTRTVLADRFEGKRFNGPNDVTVRSDGAIFFTVWGLRGAAKDPGRELPFSGFYLIKDGRVTLLGGDRDTPGAAPNGITLSPDEKHLFVTAGFQRTMRYDILPDDTVAGGRTFVSHGTDGMRVDQRGSLYTTSGGPPGQVRIWSPEGKPLGTLHLPQPAGEPRARVCATNLAFGDPDDRGLYITACTHVFKIRMRQPGVRPGKRGRGDRV